MERRRKYLKFLAFVPAVVLVGGFIGYRAGAFELFPKPEPQPDPQPTASPQPPAPQPAPEENQTFMPGSKSMPVRIEPPAGAPSTAAPPPAAAPPNSPPGKPPTFIGGSKSAPIVPAAPGTGP